MQNGNTKDPVLLTGSLRYNQFLVIWGVCPRTRQQAGFLAERSAPAAAFPKQRFSGRCQKHPGRGLPYHSDEIVRDLHPLPF